MHIQYYSTKNSICWIGIDDLGVGGLGIGSLSIGSLGLVIAV